jgi:hypothetical protein
MIQPDSAACLTERSLRRTVDLDSTGASVAIRRRGRWFCWESQAQPGRSWTMFSLSALGEAVVK